MGALDLQQPAIIHQVSGGPQKPQEVLNSAVEQQGQTIIEGMKQDVIIDLGLTKKEVGMLKFDIVGNIGIITNSKGVISFFYKYSKENGVEYFTNFPDLQKSRSLKFALRETGYELKDGKLFIGGKEISQFSPNGSVNPEFVRGIDNINFYDEINETFGLMKSVIKGDTIIFDYEGMYQSILSGVMRIKDVMYFAGKKDLVSVDEKGTKLTDEEIKKLLRRAVEELPNQCSDMRFVKNARGLEMGMEVTKQELDEYLHPTQGVPLITQTMYDDCLRRIEARDRKKSQEEDIMEQSRSERGELGEEL